MTTWNDDVFSLLHLIGVDGQVMEDNFSLLKSSFAGGSLSDPVAGQIWDDTTNHLLKVRNETNNAWLTFWDTANNKPIVSDLVSADFAAAMKDAAAGTASLRSLGTGSTQALPGNTNLMNHIGYQVYTSDTTWSKPTGVTAALVICIGGGGGGGGGNINGAGTDGGPGLVSIGLVDVSGSSSYDIDVGAGGAGGAGQTFSPGGNGSAGSNSKFGSTIVVAGGGYGGTGSENSGAPGNGTSSLGTGATNPYFAFTRETKGANGTGGAATVAGTAGTDGVIIVIWVET